MKLLKLSLLAALTTPLLVYADNDKREENNRSAISFAIVGDMPYNIEQQPVFDKVIKEINKDASVRFVMHAGDIKGGGESCDDALLTQRFAQIQQFRKAVIYTPGDNEWTDCHRTSNGNFLPTERLEFIRHLFFPEVGVTLGKKPLRVASQAQLPGYETFVENTMFTRNQVLFAAVHIVGSNNNLSPWNQIDAQDSFDTPRADRLAEFQSREAAAIAWINRAFARAQQQQAQAVMIFFHGNPRFDLAADDINRTGFNAILSTLRERSREYAKPVLLAHGDFHEYLVDKPMDTFNDTPRLPNLTRLQAFGSPRINWVKVTINPKSESVFTFEQKFVGDEIK